MHAGWQWQEGQECRNGVEAAQETGQTKASAPANHSQRVDDGAVAYELEHRINTLRIPFAQALHSLDRLAHNLLGAKPLQRPDTAGISRRSDNAPPRVSRDIHCRLAQCRCRASYQQRLASLEIEVAE